jgi:hypothetical protein
MSQFLLAVVVFSFIAGLTLFFARVKSEPRPVTDPRLVRGDLRSLSEMGRKPQGWSGDTTHARKVISR